MQSKKNKVQQVHTILSEDKSKAFETLYLSIVEDLYQYGLKFTPQIQLIEDCVHDLFVWINNNYESFANIGNTRQYLMRSLRNNLLRTLEKEKRFSLISRKDYSFEIVFSVENDIVKSEEEKKRKQLIIAALNSLSSKQKEAIYLRYTKGLEYGEIAEIMKISIESCRNNIYKAIKSLRQKINTGNILLFLLVK